MRTKTLLLFFVVLAVLVAIWVFTQPKEPVAEKSADAPATAKSDAPKPAAPVISATPAQVEKPTLPPVQSSASQPAAVEASATPAEPRANLDTAIAEAARLLEARDFVTLFKEFAPPEAADHLPQGMTIEQLAQMAQADPGAQAGMQQSLDALRSIQGQTPTMGDNDNTATYQANLPDGSTKKVILKKADTGLWYIEDM